MAKNLDKTGLQSQKGGATPPPKGKQSLSILLLQRRSWTVRRGQKEHGHEIQRLGAEDRRGKQYCRVGTYL